MAARISAISGEATSNSESISTLRRAISGSTCSFRVTLQKSPDNTGRKPPPAPSRRCCATRSREQRCLAGANSSSAKRSTLVSKKLRTLMSLVAIETVAMRVASARQALKLRDAALGVVASSQLLQVLADQLVEALAESLCALSGALESLFINRKCNI